MHRIHDAFLQAGVFEHFAIHSAIFVVANALKRSTASDKRGVDGFGLRRNYAALLGVGP